MKLAYADPPYPGCARLYPEKTEVDHAALIERLEEYDGWALSTNETTLAYVLGLCPPKVRVLAWCKPNGPGPLYPMHPSPSWEPVICKPARPSCVGPAVRSYLVAATPAGFIRQTAGIIGQKPIGFCQWVIRCMGADQDDTLDDLFPGSGAMTKSWEAWRAQPSLWTEPRGSRKALARNRERQMRDSALDLEASA